MLEVTRDPNALADATDEMDIASRQRLTAEIIMLKNAVWCATGVLALIAFLLIP